MIDDETLYAYLDGELAPTDAARVEAALAGDPALAEKLARQRALRERLHSAFGPIADEAPPVALATAACPAAKVVDLAKARAERPGDRLPQWAAIAATLVAGLAGGYALRPGSPPSIVEQRGGALIATGPIADALENQLASVDQTADSVKIRLTFRDGKGAICRSFAAPDASGVACREKAQWAVRAMFAAHDRQSGPYRTAAADDAALMAYVDGIRAGDPFDATAERQAKAGDWNQ